MCTPRRTMNAPITTDSSIGGQNVEAGIAPYGAVAPGQWLDQRYELLSPIGEGSFGMVWRAVDHRLGLPVAVKLAKDQTTARAFEQEVDLLTELQHPGVVVLRDRWQTSDTTVRPYFVMEYCDSTLETISRDRGPIGVDRARVIFSDLCRTVEFIHSKNKIHRDLKPSNVLICSFGEQFIPRIADFGIAREIPSRTNTLTQGVGTEVYKSPEIGLGRRHEAPSDVFTLAVILIELLTGHARPEDNVAWWQYVHSYDASMVTELLNKWLSASLSPTALALIARAFSTVAADRPHALEFGEMFAQATQGIPVRQQWRQDRFFLDIAGTNTIGYLVGTVPAVFVDPTIHHRMGYGARTYAHAWMLGPMAGLIFVTTAALAYYFPRRIAWLALLPLVAAGVATIPILADGGEIPHGRLTSAYSIWIALTGIWLGVRQVLNSPDSALAPLLAQNRGHLFIILLVAAAVLLISPIPVLWFLRQVVSQLSPEPGEVTRLQNVAWFDASTWALLWFAGPLRETAIAWRREASIAHRN